MPDADIKKTIASIKKKFKLSTIKSCKLIGCTTVIQISTEEAISEELADKIILEAKPFAVYFRKKQD